MRKLLIVALMLTLLPAFLHAYQDSPPKDSASGHAGHRVGTGTKALENQLVGNEQRLAESEKTRDKQLLEQALADDFIFVAYNGEVFTKPKIVQAAKYMDISQYRMQNFKVRVLGPQSALLTYDLLVQGNIAGKELPQKEYASSVWVAKDGRWILVFHQETPAHHQ